MDSPFATRRSCPHSAFQRIVILLLTLAAAGAAMSCRLPMMQYGAPKRSGGTLDLVISNGSARTLLPSIDMNIASYQIKGVGPNGATLTQDTVQTTTVMSGLVVGVWNITVAALNKDGQNIGVGSSSITLSSTEAVSLSITVTPIQGNGVVSLTTTWPATEVVLPSISASLLRAAGASIPLSYTLGTGTATASDSAIPDGYYTLAQSLFDNGVLVMGSVEVVRIVAGQTTSGTFDYSNLNVVDPTLNVNITPNMNEPLTVALSGVASSLTAGGVMTATPNVSGYTGNVTYVFYLNGQAQATTNSSSPLWTFGSDLVPGNYRLDVTAFSADDQRAGSATASFTVSIPPGTVVLAWNPESDTTVVGYKLHYGQSSGSYTSVIDAGAHAMAVVSGLTAGATYYFAATAYNASGVESPYSNEISYTVPAS